MRFKACVERIVSHGAAAGNSGAASANGYFIAALDLAVPAESFLYIIRKAHVAGADIDGHIPLRENRRKTCRALF